MVIAPKRKNTISLMLDKCSDKLLNIELYSLLFIEIKIVHRTTAVINAKAALFTLTICSRVIKK
jgi:hypothetical protein